MTQDYSLENVARVLELFQPQQLPPQNRKAAAVAMILRERNRTPEMLFIERAADERDPWSGHLAFPGGKIEAGEDGRQAAIRETGEEIGISLTEHRQVGQLSDIVGTNLPVQVSCYLFMLDATVTPRMNDEVNDLFWVPLSELYNRERHALVPVSFSGIQLDVPAIRLPQPGKPVLWGITYRLVMQLHEILRSCPLDGCKIANKRYTHAVEYL